MQPNNISCNVIIGPDILYHFDRGYPDAVGRELAIAVAQLNAGYYPELYNVPDEEMTLEDPLSPEDMYFGTVSYLGYLVAEHGLLTPTGFDKGYMIKDWDGRTLNRDIEYLYLIEGPPRKLKLYCLDINKYLKEELKGNAWIDAKVNSPLWKMSPEELKRNFCKRKYEIKLPRANVPPKDRTYQITSILSHDEVTRMGLMDDPLEYGQERNGVLRTNSRKKKHLFWRR